MEHRNSAAETASPCEQKLSHLILPAIMAAISAIQAGCSKQAYQVNVVVPQGYTAFVIPSTPVEQHQLDTHQKEGFGDDGIFEWMREHCVRKSTYLAGKVYSGTYTCDDGTTRIVEIKCNVNWIIRSNEDPECPAGGWRSVYHVE